jgi:hypothetical protein
MTVKAPDTHAHVQRLVSVVKMVTMLEECNTQEQLSVVHFLWAKGLMQRIFINKKLVFMVGSVCHIKWFTSRSRNMANVSLMTKRLKGRYRSG